MTDRTALPGPSLPSGYPSPTQVDEWTAVLSGGAAAAAALLNPVLGVMAAGLAPMVARRLNTLYAARLRRALDGLHSRDVDLESALVEGPDANLKADTFRDYIAAALETESEEKIRLLLHLAEFGLKSSLRLEVLFAKRVIRTVSRIDELEMIVLAALARVDQGLKGVSLAALVEIAQISDANVLRSSLAVLQSEGLVVQSAGSNDLYRVSDYGGTVLEHLRESISKDLPDVDIVPVDARTDTS